MFCEQPGDTTFANRYTQAAEQGNAQAQNSLAYCYRYGHGVKADKAQAVQLYAAS
jgi:TPR repeat protein